MSGGQAGTKTLPLGGSCGFYGQPLAFKHRIPGRNTGSVLSSVLLVGGVLQHIFRTRHLAHNRSVDTPGHAQAQSQ